MTGNINEELVQVEEANQIPPTKLKILALTIKLLKSLLLQHVYSSSLPAPIQLLQKPLVGMRSHRFFLKNILFCNGLLVGNQKNLCQAKPT